MLKFLRLIFLLLFFASPLSCNPFIIGELYGQLGNQCFEVAAALSLAWDHGAEAFFPDFKTKKTLNIPINYEKIFWRLNATMPDEKTTSRYLESRFEYTPIPFSPNMRLAGYFQSERYFKKYKERICALLAPSDAILSYLQQKYAAILKHPKSVSIHLRTFFKEDPEHKEYPCTEAKYFQRAVSLFDKESLFVIFSDNIPFCKKHLGNLAKNMIFIENEPYYHDFFLMSLCKHNIICNSSFSWWAAYLNPNPKKIVVAPKKWLQKETNINTKDVIPKSWIVIPTE